MSNGSQTAPGMCPAPSTLLHAAGRPEALPGELLARAHVGHHRVRIVGQPEEFGLRDGVRLRRIDRIRDRDHRRHLVCPSAARLQPPLPRRAHQPDALMAVRAQQPVPEVRPVAIEHDRAVRTDARQRQQTSESGRIERPVLDGAQICVRVPEDGARYVSVIECRRTDVDLDDPHRWVVKLCCDPPGIDGGLVCDGIKRRCAHRNRQSVDSYPFDPPAEILFGDALEQIGMIAA
jgi:hypothetical protein